MGSRLRRLLPDSVLALDVARRGLAEDPLHFIVQVVRRLLPIRPPRSHRSSVWAAYQWYLADRPADAERTLRGLEPNDRPLARRLAIQLGASRATSGDTPRLRALSLYQAGHYSAAAHASPQRSRQRDRITSELAVMLPEPAQTRSTSGTSGDPTSVLMVLTNSLPYTQSGYTLRSQAILKELRQSGVKVAAATRLGYPVTIGHLGAPAVATVDGVDYYRLPAWRLPARLDERLQMQVEVLHRLVARLEPGMLHCTTDYTNAVVTRAVSRRTGLPWVYEMRGQLELSWVARLPRALQVEGADSERVRLLREKEVELAHDAHAVIVLSTVQADDLVARGVPASRISVIPNAVDQRLLERTMTPQAARRALGLPTEGIWVGSVSSLVDYEGFDVLLDAVATARATGADLRCCITGDGVSRPALVERARELGIERFVSFPGKQPAAHSATWVQALDIVAVPRRDTAVTRVVTPLKPIEAMALNRPMVLSDLPALSELVASAGSGILVAPGDADSLALALGRLVADRQLRMRLADQGREFAATRTWPNAALACRNIYEAVCHV
ncbi:glycosyltransferase [Epidermidibacterium keratini]|nr:glycosyltransferase [Epidermidibacterium keratini]